MRTPTRLAQKVVLSKAGGGRDQKPKIMIIITDGESSYDKEKTIPYANEAKAAGTLVIVLGVGNKTSQAELNGMASMDSTGKPLKWEVGGYDMLTPIQNKLAHEACQVPDVTNSTQPVEPCGSVCTPVLCLNRCQYGYAATNNSCLTCNCLPDIVKNCLKP